MNDTKTNIRRPSKSCHSTTVRLPNAPLTRSPVPWLTSIHAREGRGDYGDAGYRGNCSGLLIEDLLGFYQPKTVLDPMAGSGTCGDVCNALGINCHSYDIRDGFNAADPDCYTGMPPIEFVWLHPPYWQLIRYSGHPGCLSEAESLDEFLKLLDDILSNCKSVLKPGGLIALLMGDYKQDGLYLGLPFRTLQVAEKAGLWLAAPEIIRFGHGSTSSSKVYNTSFIPRLHDVCLVLKRLEDLRRH